MAKTRGNILVSMSLLLIALLQLRTVKLDLPYRYLGDEWYFYLSAISIWDHGLQTNPLYPPLGPYATSIVYKIMEVTGNNPEISKLATATHLAGRVVSVFITLLACCFLFQVGKLSFSPVVGFAMMWLYAVDPFVFEMGHTIRGDPFAYMFMSASLFFALRALRYPANRRLVWYSTISMFLAILGKYSVAPLAVIPAYLWLCRFVPSVRRQIILCITLLVTSALLVVVIRTFGGPIQYYFEKSGFLFLFNQNLFSLPRLVGSLGTITEFQSLLFVVSALSFIVVALLFWQRMNSIQRKLYILLAIAIIGTGLIFSMTEARYRDIFVIPYCLFILWAVSIAVVTTRFLRPRAVKLLLLVAVLIFVLPGYINAFKISDFLRKGDSRVLAAKWIEQNVNKTTKIFKEYDPTDFLPHVSGFQGPYLPWEGKSGRSTTMFDHTPEEWWNSGVFYVVEDERTTPDWFDSGDKSKFNGFTLAYQTPHGVRPGPRLAIFYTFSIQTQVNFRFADIAQLYGYHVNDRNLCPGKQLISRLFIRDLRKIDTDYETSITIRDPASGQTIFTKSQIPMMGVRPTTVWDQYELVFDDHWIDLPVSLKPGKYNMEMAMVDPNAGHPLDVFDETGAPFRDAVPMGEITFSATCTG